MSASRQLDARDVAVMAHPELREAEVHQHVLGALDLLQQLAA